MWAAMVIASAVCLLLGLLLSTVVKGWQGAALGSLGCFLILTALGGWFWPMARSGPPVNWVMNATPTRWAFEGLLLLESPYHPSPATTDKPAATTDRDLAEDYFPADSERMGPGADLMALSSMLIGVSFAPCAGVDQAGLSAQLTFPWKPPFDRRYTICA